MEFSRSDLLGLLGTEAALHTIIGKLIGRGVDRQVYECPLCPDLVVKIDIGGRFANVEEFRIWQGAKGNYAAKFLAPCALISSDGNILFQHKTYALDAITFAAAAPKTIPWFLTDTKIDNWGRLPNGQIVCHDYSSNLFQRDLPMFEGKLKTKKPEWRTADGDKI